MPHISQKELAELREIARTATMNNASGQALAPRSHWGEETGECFV